MFKRLRDTLANAIYEQPPATGGGKPTTNGQPRPVIDEPVAGPFVTAARSMATPPPAQFSDGMTRDVVDKIYHDAIAATKTPAAATFLKRMTALEKTETDAHKRATIVVTLMAAEGITIEAIRADLQRVFGTIDNTTQKLRGFVENRLNQISRDQTQRDSAAREQLAQKKDQLTKLQNEIRNLDQGLQTSDQDAKAAAERVQELMRTIGLEHEETTGEMRTIADLLG